MKSSKHFVIVVAGLLLLFSCSSAPSLPDRVDAQKNSAAGYLTYGQNDFDQGQYDQALKLFQLALSVNTSVDYSKGIAVSYNSVASALMALGRYAEAQQSLEAGEQAAFDAKSPDLVAQNLVLRAQWSIDQNQTSVAKRLLKAAQPFPSTSEGARLWQAWALVEQNLKHPEAARLALQEALTINTSTGDKKAQASNWFMIGSLDSQAGQTQTAFEDLQKALQFDKEEENSVAIGQDLRVLGLLAEKLGHLEKAYDFLLRSERLFQAVNLPAERLKTLNLLIPLAQKLKKPSPSEAS
ncbi:MAG: tetratricopeptide repeat protein [Spirochaetales bacterium]|nr:tetratricopeptide repeat protein [Spirochaetales bacterium]